MPAALAQHIATRGLGCVSVPDILRELAKTVSSLPPADAEHRNALRDGAKALYRALGPDTKHAGSRSGKQRRGARSRKDEGDPSQMTPEEEVLLLHVME